MESSSRSSTLFWFFAAALLVGAVWIRVYDARVRQFHADEGVQAFQAWKLIETGEYRYDPTEHHGPTLYYFAKWLYPVIKRADGSVDDFRMRIVPMLFGVATLALGIGILRWMGEEVAFLWGALAAFAPLPVIYSGYFAQEGMLAFFTLAAFVAAIRYLRSLTARWAVAFGLFCGLMFATKETSVLHIGAMVPAMVFVARGERLAWGRQLAVHAGLALLVGLLVASLFLSSFLSHPGGILDAFAAFGNYADRAQGQGHEKPFGYYLGLFLPQTREGVRWGETAFLCAVSLGLIAIWRGRNADARGRVAFGVAVFACGLFLAYSIIPYKTPWLMLTPYLALLCVAVHGARFLFLWSVGRKGVSSWALMTLACGFTLWMTVETAHRCYKAAMVYSSATRNPYLYEHTTSRYSMLLDRLQELQNQIPEDQWELGVYSPDAAWPLPWHLRSVPRVGYWANLDSFATHTVDLVDSRLMNGETDTQLNESRWELYGLRPNTLIALRRVVSLEEGEAGEGE